MIFKITYYFKLQIPVSDHNCHADCQSPICFAISSPSNKLLSNTNLSSRGESNSEYMLMSPQQQNTPSTSLLKKGTPPSSYSSSNSKSNMEIPLKASGNSGKRNGGSGGTIHHHRCTLIRFWKALQI